MSAKRYQHIGTLRNYGMRAKKKAWECIASLRMNGKPSTLFQYRRLPVEVVVNPRSSIFALVVCLAFVGLACDTLQRFSATNIKEILDHPRDYEKKEVTIYGTVINTASILVVKYFEVQDSTGTIKVVTEGSLPAKGDKITVTGQLSVIEVGSQRWVVLKENRKADNTEKQG